MAKDPIELWYEHKWKIILALGGFIFALLILFTSFWKAMFIILCVGIGVLIGRYFDKKKGEDFFKND